MPTRPRTHYPVEPIARSDSPANEPSSAPATATDPERSRPSSAGDSPDAESVWVRLEDAGGDRADRSTDREPTTVSVADVESELDGLGVEVVATGPGTSDVPPADRDRQRVIDRYERIVAERDREIRDRDGDDGADGRSPGRGIVAAVRSRADAILDRLGP